MLICTENSFMQQVASESNQRKLDKNDPWGEMIEFSPPTKIRYTILSGIKLFILKL